MEEEETPTKDESPEEPKKGFVGDEQD